MADVRGHGSPMGLHGISQAEGLPGLHGSKSADVGRTGSHSDAEARNVVLDFHPRRGQEGHEEGWEEMKER